MAAAARFTARGVDLSGRSLFTPALEGFGVDPELCENGKQPARRTRTAMRSTSTASPAMSTASGRTSRGAVSRPGSAVVPLVVYGHHAQRDTENTEKHAHRCREPDRRADQLQVQLGHAQGLTLLLQGNNLTNEHAVTRQSPETVGAAGSSTGLLPWLNDDYGRCSIWARRTSSEVSGARGVEACRVR